MGRPFSAQRRLAVAGAPPLAIAAIATLALWAFVVAFCQLFVTIPGDSLGRVNDFLLEAEPPLRRLFDGHVIGFLATSPAYIGSLISRSPFALVAMSMHANWETVYMATALPCVLAGPVLGAWLQLRLMPDITEKPRRLWLWLSPFGLLMLINPVFVYSLVMGHPEEVVSAALSIAGVVQAGRGRTTWAMLLVGLAAANKSWALVAVPVAIAVAPRVSWRGVLVLIVPIAGVYGLQWSVAAGGATTTASSSGSIFLSPQVWWWFGPHFLFAAHAHQLILVLAVGLSAAWRLWGGRSRVSGGTRLREALLLLALVLLVRAALDPWDNIYYQLPFLMTVYALEIGRAPRVSLVATLALMAGTLPLHTATLDTHAIAYQLAAVPMIVVLALRVFLAPETWQHWVAAASAERRLGRGPAVSVGPPVEPPAQVL